MVRVLALLSALLLALPVQGEGVIDYINRAVDAQPKPSSSSSSRSTTDGDCDADNLLGQGIALAVCCPFLLPRLLLEQQSEAWAYFPAHPYATREDGYLTLRLDAPKEPDLLKTWSVRASLEEGNNFDGINRVGGRFLADTSTRFGIAANFDWLAERRPCGCYDDLWLADVELTYRFAQSGWMQMHAGLGARGMFDTQKSRGGFNFLYSADVFPIEPVVVSSSLELGNLNNAFVMRLRATVGVQWHRAEVFAGYDWLRIESADIHGPMAGLRLWF